MDSYKSGTVTANGINVHYLDWGGDGPALVFLAGWGCNSYIFGEFAPRFTDRFHVLAIDRRGHGDSDHPETGYDIDTLIEDLRQALDALGIERAILAGHSLAGKELDHFSIRYPDRVIKLIYLDAAVETGATDYLEMFKLNPLTKIELPGLAGPFTNADEYEAAVKYAYPSLAAIWGPSFHEQSLHEIKVNEEGHIVDRQTDAIGAAIGELVNHYLMPEIPRQIPVLSLFAWTDYHYFLAKEWMTAEQQAQIAAWFEQARYPWLTGWIEEYKRRVPHARVVVIPEGHHYIFLAHEEVVYEEMRKFLGEN